jgi:hypothetical protein
MGGLELARGLKVAYPETRGPADVGYIDDERISEARAVASSAYREAVLASGFAACRADVLDGRAIALTPDDSLRRTKSLQPSRVARRLSTFRNSPLNRCTTPTDTSSAASPSAAPRAIPQNLDPRVLCDQRRSSGHNFGCQLDAALRRDQMGQHQQPNPLLSTAMSVQGSCHDRAPPDT